MRKVTPEEKQFLAEKFITKKRAYGRSKIAIEAIDKLQINESLFITTEELEGVNIHSIYVSLARKGKKIARKRAGDKSGYYFTYLHG